MSALANIGENITQDVLEHAEVVRGHDAVHPDRDTCGGVGACALMRAEHDAEQRLVEVLESAARRDLTLQVTASKGRAR